MAQWSDAMKLKEVAFFQGYLSHPGVYEIGYMGAQGFEPMYIGSTNRSLYLRLISYNTSRCHNAKLAVAMKKDGNELWCHVARIDDSGYGEAMVQYLQEVSGAGQYDWNRAYDRGRRNAD